MLEADCLICHLKGYNWQGRALAVRGGFFNEAPMVGAGWIKDLKKSTPSVRSEKPKATFFRTDYTQTKIADPANLAELITKEVADENCWNCHAMADVKKRGKIKPVDPLQAIWWGDWDRASHRVIPIILWRIRDLTGANLKNKFTITNLEILEALKGSKSVNTSEEIKTYLKAISNGTDRNGCRITYHTPVLVKGGMGDTWLFKEKDARINQRASHTARGTEKLIVTTHKGADFDALASIVAANLLYPGIVTVLPARNGRQYYPDDTVFKGAENTHSPYSGQPFSGRPLNSPQQLC